MRQIFTFPKKQLVEEKIGLSIETLRKN
jgi:hypothetical protein